MTLGIIFGSISIAVALGLLALFMFVIIPRHLKYKVIEDAQEGILSPDLTSYLPEHENANYIDSYTIVVDRGKSKKFMQIKYKEDVHDITFFVVLFDAKHKPFAVRNVHIEDAQLEKSTLVEIDAKTFGLYLQVEQVGEEEFEGKMPLFLSNSKIVKTSIYAAIIITLMTFLFSFGLSAILSGENFPGDPYFFEYIFPGTTKFIAILAVIVLVVSFAISYFLIKLLNRKYLSEDVKL